MKYFTCFYLFLYLFFVVTFLTESVETQVHYKGIKRLWPPYTTRRPTLTSQCHNITHHTTDRTTNISIDWVHKTPDFMKDDYYSNTEKRKHLRLKIHVRTIQPNIRVFKNNHEASTPNVPKLNIPTILVFAWTTTHKLKPRKAYLRTFSDYYIDDNVPFNKNLNRHRSKFRWSPVYRNLLPMPTISSLEKTNIKRFTSTEKVKTFFAPRTETQRDVIKEDMNSEVEVDRILSALKRNMTHTPERRFRSRSNNTYAGVSCYVCGLNRSDNADGIPRCPSCYNFFDGPDSRYKFRSKRLKRACHYDLDGKQHRKNYSQSKKWYGKIYRNGCFRRFTDVGIEYNELGCRTMEPIIGFSYASHRFSKLEKTLKYVDEGCVISPVASLTPFNRAISLYVRFHVCVCQGKWCNRAPELRISKVIIFVVLFIYYIRINPFS